MLTSKQRAYLRSLAVKEETILKKRFLFLSGFCKRKEESYVNQ